MSALAAIEASLELAAARGGDITDVVYERLFAALPDMQPLFVRDTTGAVRGEMLTKVIELVLDLAGPDAYATNFIRSEVVTHDGYGVDPAAFAAFFPILRDHVQALAGAEWTSAMDAAWTEVLRRTAGMAVI